MIGRRAGILFSLLLSSLARGAVLINEIGFDEPSGSPDWIELHNPGPGSQSVDGWTLSDFDAAAGNEIRLSFPVPIPEGAFLVVWVDADGPLDADFMDGAGAVYTGTGTTVSLSATEDEVALFSGPSLSSGAMVDFVAWVTVPPYDGGTNGDQDLAVAAGLWTEGDAVALSDVGSGYSIGRTRDSLDTNRPADFRFFQYPTRGLSNVPPPSPFPAALTADPARRAFSPFDADPAYQSTRFFFNVSAESLKFLRVLDVRGRTMRTLVENNRELAGGDLSGVSSGSVVWDGKDDRGTVVPLGVYLVVLEATDPASGQTSQSRARVAVGRPP